MLSVESVELTVVVVIESTKSVESASLYRIPISENLNERIIKQIMMPNVNKPIVFFEHKFSLIRRYISHRIPI